MPAAIRSLLPNFDNSHACKPWPRDPNVTVLQGVILDTETTGLDPVNDPIIEIAILPFSFDMELGHLYMVQEPLIQMQDPGKPISPEASAVNGITDAMVKGKSINWEEVYAEIDAAHLVIAHNAAFDRPRVDAELNKRGLNLDHKVWGCSLDLLKWEDVPVNKQEVLCAWLGGFVYPAHRAEADVHALLHLLHTQKRLPELLHRANLESKLLLLNNLRYVAGQPEMLKGRGFKFDGTSKRWYKVYWPDHADQLEADRRWAIKTIYVHDRDAAEKAAVQTITPNMRYSAALGI